MFQLEWQLGSRLQQTEIESSATLLHWLFILRLYHHHSICTFSGHLSFYENLLRFSGGTRPRHVSIYSSTSSVFRAGDTASRYLIFFNFGVIAPEKLIPRGGSLVSKSPPAYLFLGCINWSHQYWRKRFTTHARKAIYTRGTPGASRFAVSDRIFPDHTSLRTHYLRF